MTTRVSARVGVCAGVLLACAGHAQVIDPVGGDHGPGQPGIGDAPAPLPQHPPLHLIPPIPMPEPAEAPGAFHPGSTVYDARTGQQMVLPVMPPSGLSGGMGGGMLPATAATPIDAEPLSGFGSMTVAGSLDSYPRSPNCKIAMRFTDTGGNQWWFAGSGSMQDPGVVITASHCVYMRTFTDSGGTTRTVNNWADIIYVYPGWDGVSVNGPYAAPTGTEVINNFGWMSGTFYQASNTWINSGSFENDVALIRCTDRSAGALTGSFGWAWGFDCGTIQGRTYNNFSYPAQTCGGGLHTGTTMYFLSGTWDSCPGNQLRFNTSAGCTTAVWGGMSGSGAYYMDGSSRLVHAICSNSNRSTQGQYAKLWEQFVTDMGGFITGTRGAGFDPETLRFRTAATTAQAGTSFPGGTNVLLTNASNADPGSQTYTLRVYLSSNNNISASDTLLGTWNYTWDFGPMSSVTFNVPGPFIPASVAPGTYFIGVELDAPGDVDTSNNDTDTWDAQQVTITAAAPSNDTCGSPLTLAVNSPVFGSNTTANNEGGTSCGFQTGKDVWFSFTPTCSDVYEFTTCGSSFDPVLSLHSACPGTTANQLACNDDDFNAHCASGNIRDSWFSAALTAGTTYYVRLSGYNGASGTWGMEVRRSVPNDNCASATPVADGVYTYNSCGATTDGPSEPENCNFFSDPNISSDLWYRYTATVDGVATAALCGSSYDTDLAVYGASCPVAGGSVLTCNDDDGSVNCTTSSGLHSWTQWNVTAGQEYLIRVGGYAGSTGAGVLTLSSVAVGGCGTADYNCDGDIGTDADIEAFFACLGGTCPPPPCTSSADFNGDGDIGTDQDIEAFFRVLGGGTC
ncbi:MAG TPA: hypothetical protein VD997_13290 [Phycisphaerales bacterium]|nr:hypothetical protein [Phycisphaerales bacterium]